MDKGKKHWLDDPRNVDKIFWWLCGLCAVLTLADLFYTKKDTHYGVERIFGFYGVYGFVCCFLLVLAAKQLRRLLKRDENYYDR